MSVDIGKTGLIIEETNYEEIYYNNFKAGAFSEKNIQSTSLSKIKDIDASTLIPENNKFKEIKVKDFKTQEVLDDKIFYMDLYSTSFTFPSLRQGAITQLTYTIDIKEPLTFPYEILKRYYPIENFEFVINSDKNIEFEIKYFNTDSSNIEFKKEEKNGRLIYSWKEKDIKSYKTETQSPGYLYYLPHVIPYIKSYKIDNKEVNVLRNVDDLFKWYNENISKIDHKHTDEMISTVNTLIANCISDSSKVATVYKWVQSNIKYVANEYGLGGYVPRDPYIIFEKRYGDCKDMASIIIELLEIAGVKAYYTWIGTRELPYSYHDISSPIVDNHMIATYIENNTYYFLDATNSYNPIELPSSFIQGKEALIKINDDKYEIKKVPEVSTSTNTYSDTLKIYINDKNISGKGSLNLKGYYFSDTYENIERIKDNTDKKKFLTSYLEIGNNKFVLDNYKINTSSNALNIDFTFNVEDYISFNGNEMYINMNLSQAFKDFELFKDDRKLDYEFSFKSNITQTFILTIPESYEVEYLPNKSGFENDDFYYNISYEIKGNQIIYHFSHKTETMLLKPESFTAWNKMIKQIRSDYKDVVVLKKKI